jgi:hypothetical protein
VPAVLADLPASYVGLSRLSYLFAVVRCTVRRTRAKISSLCFLPVAIIFAGSVSSAPAQILPPAKTVIADYTLTPARPVVFCDASRGPVLLSLPKPEAKRSFNFIVVKIDRTANACAFNQKIEGKSVAITDVV